ncbi:MAG: penicillin-binding protein activator [Sneathiella sp.]|nr:penicillin-binding protein activator [Sneathiella sp.]
MTAKDTLQNSNRSPAKSSILAWTAGLTLSLLLAGCQTLPFNLMAPPEKPVAAKPDSNTKAANTPPVLEALPLEAEKKTAETINPASNLAPEILSSELNSQAALSLRPPALSDEKEATKIAILLPLTGQHKNIGNDLLRAAYMALFDLGNKNLHLLPYDTKGTPTGARNAALAATGEGTQIILGPLFSTSVSAVRPIAAANNINVLTFSTDDSISGDGVYLMGLTAGQQITRIMEFSYRQGLARFAVLAPQSLYGDAVIRNIQQTSEKLGLELDKILRYPSNLAPGSEELRLIAKEIANYDARRWQLKQQIKKLEALSDPKSKAQLKRLSKRDTLGQVSFDALIIPEGGQRLLELAPLLSYYDVDPTEIQFIGTGLWADKKLTTEPALVGGWFAAPEPVKTQQFQSRFNKTYGYNPPRIASLAYDAAALAGLLALDTRPDKFSRAALENNIGFTGYNGVFRFSTTGIAERGLAVMQVGQRELELLEEAPESFEALIN